jgi:hypothetical protein
VQSFDPLSHRGTSATPSLFAWFTLLIFCAAVPSSDGLVAEKTDWKTGVEFRRQLESQVGVNWGDNPLRDALGRLSRAQQVAIFLDRRVDPDQRVEFESRDESFEVALTRLCGHLNLGRSIVGSVVYIGPKESADKLATLAALRRKEAAELSPAAKARWLKQDRWGWDELASPNGLLEKLQQSAKFSSEGSLPHDVWPAGNLPPLPLADRLSLLLAGFGMTFQFEQDGNAVKLVPMPDDVEYEHSYTRTDPAKLAADLKRQLPEIQIERRGTQVIVRGRFEDHEKIERMLHGEKVRTITSVPGDKRFTLKVANQPAGAVARTIAKELGKELKYDPEILPKLKEPVSFSVKEVSVEELLRTTLEPLGLTATVGDQTLDISAID